ncbi:MAG: hypothetical protein D6758_12625 [Gammaproteobacteria bacterium]|nr:MAG: hypothetical protein D6758_12625 [Gammaproteobacteria bacterium]
MVKQIGRALLLVGWLTALASPALSRETVLLVAPPFSPVSHELRQFLAELGGARYDFVLVNQDEVLSLESQPDMLKGARVITLGVEALQAAATRLEDAPVLAMFIRQDQYREQSKAFSLSSRQYSAIYLESPPRRQLNLISILMPQARSVAMLNSMNAKTEPPEGPLKVNSYLVSDAEALPRLLVRALRQNDALLATADPSLYNRQQTKLILLSAYRLNRPVFGPSLAFVRAGSLATTFSSIGDFSREVIEALEFHDQHGYWPKAGYSRYFSVAVNRRVARSMSLNPPDDEVLRHELERMESQP